MRVCAMARITLRRGRKAEATRSLMAIMLVVMPDGGLVVRESHQAEGVP